MQRGGRIAAAVGHVDDRGHCDEKADAASILTMYADINAAFARSPTEGLDALIATQYPATSPTSTWAAAVGAGHVADRVAVTGATKATTPAKLTSSG